MSFSLSLLLCVSHLKFAEVNKYFHSTFKQAVPLFPRLLEIIWRRSMNPLLYYDSIYALTRMKKNEDSYRQFIFEFISNEWNELLLDSKLTSENSFIHQLMTVSKGGRNYSRDEVNDHIGTMLTAVSLYFVHSPFRCCCYTSPHLPFDFNL